MILYLWGFSQISKNRNTMITHINTGSAYERTVDKISGACRKTVEFIGFFKSYALTGHFEPNCTSMFVTLDTPERRSEPLTVRKSAIFFNHFRTSVVEMTNFLTIRPQSIRWRCV